MIAMGDGLWLAHRERRRPPRQLVWPMEGPPLLDESVLRDAQLQWRGPLAFLHWRDGEGRLQHLAWWPDTLSKRSRRELRLAAAGSSATRPDTSMAP